MISRNSLEESILRECDICLHLFTKLPPESYDHRPTSGQRSTAELLRYLSFVAIAYMKCMSSGDWSAWREYGAQAKEMPPGEFPAAMKRQMGELREIFAGLTEEDLETRMVRVPWGEEMPMGPAILETVLKWMVGYKMQLFLYAKASGASEISTANCWRGIDSPPAEKMPEKTEQAV